MKAIIVLLLTAGFIAVTQANETPGTIGQEYQAIEKEFNSAMAEFSKVYQTAQTDEERQKLFQEKYPKPDQYAARMRALAAKNPQDPVAADALIWAYLRDQREPFASDTLELLLKHHGESEKLGTVAEMLGYGRSRDAQETLEKILAKTPHREVKGLATFGLANLAYRSGGRENLTPEAEKLFQQVIDEYADVKGRRGPVADQAKGILFAAKNLAAGKPAPEIEGEDVDGQGFKLSDYRGKVVLIDFWGDW